MRIIFGSISSVKKEATKLHKSIKSQNLSSSLSISQNIIAKAYGWKHFNEMSLIYERIAKNGLLDNVTTDGVIQAFGSNVFHDMQLISSTSQMERRYLSGKLGMLISNYLASLGADTAQIDGVLMSFFDRRNAIKRVVGSDKYSHLSQLTCSDYNRHVLIRGGVDEQRLAVYMGVPLSVAMETGGLFILDSPLANAMYDNLLKIGCECPIHVIDFTGDIQDSHFKEKDIVPFDALMYDRSGKSAVGNYYRHESFNKDLGEAGELLATTYFLEAFYESVGGCADSGCLSRILRKETGIFYTIRNHYNPLLLLNSLSKEDYCVFVDFACQYMINPFIGVENCNWSMHLSKNMGLEQGKEVSVLVQGKGLFERLFSIVCGIVNTALVLDSNPLKVNDSIESMGYLNDIFARTGIVLVSVNLNNMKGVLCAQAVLAHFRTSLIPHLGVRLSGESNPQKNKRERKVVVLDRYDQYMMRGVSVVAAQSRALNLMVFFSIKDIGDIDNEEYVSLLANIGLVIMLSLHDYFSDPLGDLYQISSLRDVRRVADKQIYMDRNQCVLKDAGEAILLVNLRSSTIVFGWSATLVGV